MNIYKLVRTDDVDYDETAGLVIAAQSPERAQEIAHDEARGDQSPDIWYAPTTEVECIGIAVWGVGTGILLTDFLRG